MCRKELPYEKKVLHIWPPYTEKWLLSKWGCILKNFQQSIFYEKWLMLKIRSVGSISECYTSQWWTRLIYAYVIRKFLQNIEVQEVETLLTFWRGIDLYHPGIRRLEQVEISFMVLARWQSNFERRYSTKSWVRQK